MADEWELSDEEVDSWLEEWQTVDRASPDYWSELQMQDTSAGPPEVSHGSRPQSTGLHIGPQPRNRSRDRLPLRHSRFHEEGELHTAPNRPLRGNDATAKYVFGIAWVAGTIRVMVLFPASLRRGDRVGVTFPSAGVEGPGADRIDFCVRWLRDAGIDVVVGDLMDGTGITSGPAAMCNLAGTPYGDVAGFGRQHADDGLTCTWRQPATTQPPSAATCTACVLLAGSSTRKRL